MFDVIPPSGGSGPVSRPPQPKPVRKPSVPPVGPRTVEIAWQLPARLRRPVHEELARQRHAQQRRAAIVQFERRPIYTESPSRPPQYRGEYAQPAAPAPQRGAEYHTGDVYRHARPGVRMSLPPYRGSAARPGTRPLPAARPVAHPNPVRARPAVPPATRPTRPATTPTRVPVVATAPKPTTAQSPPRPRPMTPASSPLGRVTAERDVPFIWPTSASAQVTPPALTEVSLEPTIAEPKRRFALPLHFSIFPKNLLPKKAAPAESGTRKKKLRLRDWLM